MGLGLLAAALVVLGLCEVQAQKRQVMLDKVVAVVGSSSILYSDIEEYAGMILQRRREAGYTSDRDPRNEALEQLLMQKLLFNQAQLDSVEINVGEVSQRVEETIQAAIEQVGSIAALEEQEHMPIFNIRDMIRQRFEEQAFAQAMQHTVMSKVTIVPGEVEQFYRRTSRDSLPMIPEQYVYAQITKYPYTRTEARQRTKERLLEMRERIISGQTRFDVMARMYSIDAAAMRGGEMDPQPLAGFVKPFADALEELRPGQISEVVETQFGFHLIQLIDKKGRLYHCRHIVLRPTYTPDELAAPGRFLDSIANLIRHDSLTFEQAALAHSDDAGTKMNGGIVTNHDLLEAGHYYNAEYSETRFTKEHFGGQGGRNLEDYYALRMLEVGQVSDAYQCEDFMNGEQSKIVKLVRVIPAHTASLEEDYLRIEQMALAEKQDRVFQEWLSRHIDGMYVFIEEDLRDGDFSNKNWVK